MKQELNLSQKLLKAGFKVWEEEFFAKQKYRFRPNDNWMGCSTYHPDHTLTKGNITVYLSLQGGIAAHYAKREEYPILERMAARAIIFKRGKEILYRTMTGEMPGNALVQRIIIDSEKRVTNTNRCSGFRKKHLRKPTSKKR